MQRAMRYGVEGVGMVEAVKAERGVECDDVVLGNGLARQVGWLEVEHTQRTRSATKLQH